MDRCTKIRRDLFNYVLLAGRRNGLSDGDITVQSADLPTGTEQIIQSSIMSIAYDYWDDRYSFSTFASSLQEARAMRDRFLAIADDHGMTRYPEDLTGRVIRGVAAEVLGYEDDEGLEALLEKGDREHALWVSQWERK
jgi:hypothetical protein